MQQLILAAGKGTRLQTTQTNKCFTLISDKTLLDYNLELGSMMGVSEVIVVIGHNAEHIRNYLGDFYNNVPITYVYQEQQLGIAHAVKIASKKLTTSFFMALSDELLIKPRIMNMKKVFRESNADCVCGMVPDSITNIQKAYTIDLTSENSIRCLIEKPTEAFNKFRGTGYCMMSLSMIKLLEKLKPSKKRNEYEMGDWIQSAIDNGLSCIGYQIADKGFNINEPEDIEQATKAVKEVLHE